MVNIGLDINNNFEELGLAIYGLIEKLYPICRSITGEGVRETLRIIQQIIPLKIHEVPTGTQVFDWKVPKEWNINDAYVKNSQGIKVIDFKRSNLHILNYSIPIHQKISLVELKRHLFTLPEYPDWIPYRTSYYKENWGFCVTHNQFISLEDDQYEVLIDSSLEQGHLTYGEYYIEGESLDEVLISCHLCHPSLCNDNLSGIAVSTFLAKSLTDSCRRYSYRFLFVPGTIGPITWLALNEEKANRIKYGLVLALLGDSGMVTYKKSRQDNAEIDRIVAHVLRQSGECYKIIEFSPYGYDERQYCSPGFDLPVGSLTRTPYGCYPEYHTSADDLKLVQPKALVDSLLKCNSIVEIIENNYFYLNQNPKCEPQLGRRGLYQEIGGDAKGREMEMALLWVLNFSDGVYSLLDIAERAGLYFSILEKAAQLLEKYGLLIKIK